MERFGDSSYADVENFKALSKNVKSTNKWINCYCSWAKDRNQPEEIEVLAPSVLDNILQQFFAEIKKQHGDDYEPNSLCGMQASIERYLPEKQHSILNSRQFASSRAVLQGKARSLRMMGKENLPTKHAV